MTRRAAILLVLLGGSGSRVAEAEGALPPRLVPDAGGTVSVEGLPAIAGDGSTIAAVEPFETSSDAGLLAVRLLDAADGSLRELIVVYERSDSGTLLPFPTDGLGATLWRRARNLSDRFAAEGYRPLAQVGEAGGAGLPVLDGAGFRILQRLGTGRYALRDARTGRRLASGRLPPVPYFCGMESETPQDIPPAILSAWWDPPTRTVLVAFGHVYASCMCPSSVDFATLHLARP